MKYIYIFILFLLTQLNGYSQISRSDCPVKEETFTHIQSDGTKIKVHVWGSEMITYFETEDGYTLLKNNRGDFEYAVLNQNNDMVASGIIARATNQLNSNKIVPSVRYSNAQIERIESQFHNYLTLNKKAGGKPFPSKGVRKVLTLLIQFPDLNATFAKNNFDSLMVKKNYLGTGSFRDYYLKSSYGQLELNSDVFGWYMAPSGYINYGKSNSSYMNNVGNLVKRAILAADSAGVDFSQYDNDGDGYVDGIIILHAGIGAEEQSAPNANNYIWSHRYNLSYTVGAVNVDGVNVDAYGIFPEKRYSGGAYNMVGIGVISHEFGHLLDLPDLYSTQSKGEGAGNYANMAGGPWLNGEKSPCLHDAWSRMALGWVNPIVLNATGTYTIPKSLADSNFTFRINTSQSNEFFLLENRQKKGFDYYLPSKGLAVWHINTTKARVLSQASNNVNNDTSAYGVGLLQADGLRHLEKGTNRGDAADLFPGSTNNRSINTYTSPNTLLHYKLSGVKQPSNIVISNITYNSDSSITFTLGNKPTAGFDAIPATGCAPLYVQFNNVSAFADRFKWKFSDNTESTQKNTEKTFTLPGTYPVILYALDSNNSVLDSFSQNIVVQPSPQAIIEITRSDSNKFELKSNSKDALYVVWKFGSNQSSTQPELTYTLTNNDVDAMLIAYSTNMCTDTARFNLDFWPLGLNSIETNPSAVVYPNPFESGFNISINLPSQQEITMKLYDVTGKLVEEKTSAVFSKGINKVEWNRNNLPSGIYFIQIQSSYFNKILSVNAR